MFRIFFISNFVLSKECYKLIIYMYLFLVIINLDYNNYYF